jgi:hypothetical protein
VFYKIPGISLPDKNPKKDAFPSSQALQIKFLFIFNACIVLETEEGVINLALAMLGEGRWLKRLMNMKLEFPNDSVSHTEHVRAEKRGNWNRRD